MSKLTCEDEIKIKNKYVAGISRTFYLSIETINRPPQFRETIPLTTIFFAFEDKIRGFFLCKKKHEGVTCSPTG
jgi:hypothetical protein